MMDAATIERLRAEFLEALGEVTTERAIRTLRDQYLGRKSGILSMLMKSLAEAPPEHRPALGRLVNDLKGEIESALAARLEALSLRAAGVPPIDVTLSGRQPPLGHRHPLTIVRTDIERIFGRMGYHILEGPETEDEYHNFEALNMPAAHPARDMQDTLYLEHPFPHQPASEAGAARATDAATLLRTHTSAMQIRYMEASPPPVRLLVIGKVFRRDNLDLTHTPMFHQVEGLVVGEEVTLGDLKGTLVGVLRELFHPDVGVRFRPSFFPYTEPSAEVDISCVFCGGEGCAICKRTGWLEILGSGMVHPAVFEAVGYDPERYTGFAFGLGIERIAMLKYRVDDIRLFYENDLRFLGQFPS